MSRSEIKLGAVINSVINNFISGEGCSELSRNDVGIHTVGKEKRKEKAYFASCKPEGKPEPVEIVTQNVTMACVAWHGSVSFCRFVRSFSQIY